MENEFSNLNTPNKFHGCPYFGDSGTKTLFRIQDGRCHATASPTILDLEYQDSFCLNEQYKSCPVFVQFAANHTPPNLTLKNGFWVPTRSSNGASKRGVRILAGVLLLLLLFVAGFWLINQNENPQAFAQTPATTLPTHTATPGRPRLTESAVIVIDLSPTVTVMPTATQTVSPTPKPSATATATQEATASPSATATATQTVTATATATQVTTAVPVTQPPPTATVVVNTPNPTPSEPVATATKISLSP